MIVVEFLVGAAIIGVIMLAGWWVGKVSDRKNELHSDVVLRTAFGVSAVFVVLATIWLAFVLGGAILSGMTSFGS